MTSENLFEIPVPLIIDETNKNDSTKITLDKGGGNLYCWSEWFR